MTVAWYFCEWSLETHLVGELRLAATDLAGTTRWLQKYGKTREEDTTCAASADDDGIYFALNWVPESEGNTRHPGLSVRFYDADGTERDVWEFPSLAVLLYSLSVLGDEVYCPATCATRG